MDGSNLAQLISIQQGLLNQLAVDAALTPYDSQVDYSLDGESVSREAWRSGTIARLEKLQELILMCQPFEIRTIAL